ncbi:MAG: hypothetical protein AAB949_01865 [Patescibacteria group bacterium]
MRKSLSIRYLIGFIVILLVGHGCHQGKTGFGPQEKHTTIIIGNRTFGGTITITVAKYSIDWENNAILIKCPCYVGEYLFPMVSEIKGVNGGNLKIALLPSKRYEEYVITIKDANGTKRAFSFPSH